MNSTEHPNLPGWEASAVKSDLLVTVLMPCLNEAETIGTCVRKAKHFLERTGTAGEIVVADNGSTDGSQAIATGLGARVVTVSGRGYGAALIGGIAESRGKYIVMGDADDSYDFSRLEGFISRLQDGADLVMGDRFAGGIAPGAMPLLHRYLGNPVLSFIGRLLFKIPVNDFHCGLRAFNRDSIVRIQLKTRGMEFASEMVVRSALAGLRIVEVPTTLNKDGRSRPPHLRTWRDGWRHLKFLLMYSPRWLYLVPGLLFVLTGVCLGLALLLFGPLKLNNLVLDLNSLLVSCFLTVAGVQLLTFGALSRFHATVTGLLPQSPRARLMVRLLTTDRLLLVSCVIFLIGAAAFARALTIWAAVDFGDLFDPFIPRLVIVALTTMLIGLQTAFSAFLFGIIEIPIHDSH